MSESINRDLGFISDKRVQLNSPGTIISNNYYSRENSTVDRVETTWNQSRFSTTLTNLNFGSQSTFVIPRASMLRNAYLHIELNAILPEQTISRGWGYALIANISYLMGSANVSQIIVNGVSMFQTIMLQSMSSEKRSELFRLGGEEHLSATADTIHADILLGLPFSSAGIGKKPIDTLLLDSPVTISIQIARAEQIYGGNGIKPSSMLDATASLSQGELLNMAQSLHTELSLNPEMRYAYPFIHTQSFIRDLQGNGPNLNTVDLLAFINADLLAITFYVVQNDYISGFNDTTPNIFNAVELKDIDLLFNGTVMYKSRHSQHKILNMQDRVGSSFYHNSVIAPKAIAPFSSEPVDSYIIAMNFSQLPAYTFGNHFFNVWRIGNNTMQLRFLLPDTRRYTLFATYHFNGIMSINKDTNIFFD